MKMTKRLLLAGLCTALTAGPALAQQNQGDQSTKRNQSQSEKKNDSRQNAKKVQVSPAGWIRVATDYDNDGIFDAIETLYIYDLERARQSSRERANRQAGDMRGSDRSTDKERMGNMNRQGQDGQADRYAQTDRRQDDRRQDDRTGGMRTYEQRRESLTGKIQNLRSQSMAGMDSKNVFARIKTEEGRTATVCLGSQNKLKKLDLGEGDQITVEGVRGRVNDRTVLMARKITSGDEEVQVEMQDSRRMKRVRGEVVSKRNAKFRNQDEQHVVAKVRLISGKQETVNLGPKSKVEKLELSQGDDVSMLVRPGRVNGQPALIAEQVSSGDQSIEVSTGKKFTSRSAQQNRQQGEQQVSRNRGREQGQNRRQDQNQDSQSGGQAALGIAVSDGDDGVKVEAIFPNSPAEKSTLEEGDEIVSINGESIDSARQVIQTIQQRWPNEQLEIKAKRNGETQTVRVRLADRSQLTRSRD